MNWTCEKIEERLSDYVDRLMAPAEREGFEAHAATCARCKPLVAQVSGIVAEIHHLEPLEAPPRLVYRILDATLGERGAQVTGWRKWFGWIGPIGQTRLAMGVVTVALLAVMIGMTTGVTMEDVRKIELADLKPSNLWRAADRGVNLMYAKGVKFVNGLRVVYEIQSRLQPASDSAPVTQPQPQRAPGQSEKEGKRPESNRALDLNDIPVVLASTVGLPGRSF